MEIQNAIQVSYGGEDKFTNGEQTHHGFGLGKDLQGTQ